MTETKPALTEFVPARRPGGVARFARGALRNRGARVGFVLVSVLVFVAVFAPWLAPYDPIKMGAGRSLQPPSWSHPFGTDEFGRDLFSRVVMGSRQTLTVGLVAVGISALSGLAIGLIGGYIGGWVERLLMRSIDVLFSFTEILIALATVAVLGPSLQNALVAVGIAAIPFYARVTYAQVIVEKNKPYFEAAISMGAGSFRLVFRELLPNVLPPLIVVATLGISTSILGVAGLSFLGLGAQPPNPEWGLLLAQGRNYITRAPWITTIPGIAISLAVLGFNLLGDGISESLTARGRER
jgi:peptide/nickel transport system permease protein